MDLSTSSTSRARSPEDGFDDGGAHSVKGDEAVGAVVDGDGGPPSQARGLRVPLVPTNLEVNR
ncbi:hypothetical protein ACH4D3_13840 [Streptomyces sp. NPDC018026]|uniref:hypothetical protein n=1 Tax=Streptomyces sp. NPDC018026 TaxID=3365031 RepID=UPI00379C6A39